MHPHFLDSKTTSQPQALLTLQLSSWERSRGLPGGSERIKSKRMRIESEAAKKTGSTVSIIIVIMEANDQVLVEAR
jgi:hypothetical protein